jgi:hypothetical protein
VRTPYAEAGSRLKNSIELAFLAACVVLALVAFIMIRHAAQIPNQTDQQLAEEIAAENSTYCEKWGMRPRTREHASCTLDLDDIRARHVKRVGVDAGWLP